MRGFDGVWIDPMGNVFACIVYSLGGVCGPLSRSVVVALAWCLGCGAGCRSRNDSASGTGDRWTITNITICSCLPDPVPSTRVCDARPRSNHWCDLRHGRSCDCTKRHRTRYRVPQHRHLGFLARHIRQSDGLGAVLDCVDLPDRDRARVFLVLPQGTTW